jgi:excisionase family DNA binding protein
MGRETKKTDPPQKILLTRREVAAALGFSERTVYELTRSGELPSVRFGDRGVRYSPAAIEAVIAAKTQGGAAIRAAG